MRDHRLSGDDIKFASSMPYVQTPAKNDRVLLELRGLAWLLPSCGAPHVGNAYA